MAGRNTRSSTANNTNPPNETADEERDQREATPLHYQRLGLLVKEFFSTKGAVGYYCESIESELQSLSCPLRSHNVLKPATIQGAVSMANRLTTDGIKDGLFKKTENAGNKRRSWITSRIVVKHPSVQNAILYLVTAQGLIEPLPREEIANPMLAIEGNTNQGNSRNQAQGRAFCLGVAEAPQDPNIVTGTFSLNDHFAIVLFDSGADYSFISTKFLPLINMKPSVISRFDVVVGMDWLSKLRAKIVCYEKIIQIPLSNRDILEVHEEHPRGNLKLLKTMKVNKPKLKDILVVREFPGVFPEDLSGLPPSREVEFCIDLILGAMPVAKSPYRLAPTEMQELSYQLKEIQESLHTPSSSP
ncbi:putative reverse transcriptase domain-containing protein [Tanacetum coccineum]|uniref:Reverse transcriptase domain-containing protein n=1 Tax=Tanacetum coccineum TaxID=301880 RepID=A0ABQ5FIW7_9ASTR